MTDQPPTTPPAASAPAASPPVAPSTAGMPPPPPAEKPEAQPITQQVRGFRETWPSWAKQLPRVRFPPPVPNFALIDRNKLREILTDADPAAVKRIEQDLDFLEHELLRLFRDRDYE